MGALPNTGSTGRSVCGSTPVSQAVSRAKRRIPQAYLGETRGERLHSYFPLGSEAIVFTGVFMTFVHNHE